MVFDVESLPDVVGIHGEMIVMPQGVDHLAEAGFELCGLGQRLGVDVAAFGVACVQQRGQPGGIVGERAEVLGQVDSVV